MAKIIRSYQIIKSQNILELYQVSEEQMEQILNLHNLDQLN